MAPETDLMFGEGRGGELRRFNGGTDTTPPQSRLSSDPGLGGSCGRLGAIGLPRHLSIPREGTRGAAHTICAADGDKGSGSHNSEVKHKMQESRIKLSPPFQPEQNFSNSIICPFLEDFNTELEKQSVQQNLDRDIEPNKG